MSDFWLKSSHAQVGKAFLVAVKQLQTFAADFDRDAPADRLVLAGAGVITQLMHEHLEYLHTPRRKRDFAPILERFADEVAGYKAQIGETMVEDAQVTAVLEQVLTPEPEAATETVEGPFALCVKLRYLAIPATYDCRTGLITYPASETKRVRRQAKFWQPYPGEVRDMGRQLCGLPDQGGV